MQLNNHFVLRVAEFHETFGVPVLPAPAIPDAKRSQLRVDLLAEELQELRDAIAAGDVVAAADALTDLQYVLSGTVLEFGMQSVCVALFDEVHRSNMSKACMSMDEALKTIDKYRADGVEAHAVNTGESLLVYRTSDLKILKSVNYSPANLSPIVGK